MSILYKYIKTHMQTCTKSALDGAVSKYSHKHW